MMTPEDEIKILQKRLDVDHEVIIAMQKRMERYFIRSLLWRKPWKSKVPAITWNRYIVHNFWSWLTKAHDCKDPSIGCSCSGGFRFEHLMGN